jgi:hypothetical protein
VNVGTLPFIPGATVRVSFDDRWDALVVMMWAFGIFGI